MDRKNIEDIYKLSPTQHGLLFHTLYASESSAYLEQAVWICKSLDVPNFVRAWQKVVERHPILRTGFFWEDLDEPLQVVSRRVELPVDQQDWRELDRDEQQKRLEAFLEADRRRGLDLSKAPLMRLTLIRLDETTYNVVWSYHHILLDGWSVALITGEVPAWSEAFREGQTLDLPKPRPFRDYVSWLRQKDWETAKAFWRQKLGGFTAGTPLSIDRAPGSLPNPRAAFNRQEIRLSAKMTEAVQAFSRQHRITANTLVQAAWALLLNRYGAEEDVVFGVTVHGRPTDMSGFESMVGLFINAIPVRVQILPTDSVLDWLNTSQAEFIELLRYGYSPLVQIQSWNDIPRNKPMFDYILVDQSYPGRTPDGRELMRYDLFEVTGYPLTVYLNLDEVLVLQIAYDCQRFDDDTIARILHHLRMLLTGMIADPHQPLAELSLLTPEETRQILYDQNDTAAPYPKAVTLQQLFTTRATQTPKATAVTFGGKQLTYTELNSRANQLAHYLRARGVGPDTHVGLYVERSLDMIVGLLGVLKAGGAYVPLDPAYPDQRLAFMLQDAQVKLLLTQAELASDLPQIDAPVLCLDRDWDTIAQESTDNPDDVAGPDNLAYVIYTSGSTGQPKAVSVSQRALVHYVTAASDHFAIMPDDSVLQFASISFDTAAEEIYPCLLNGATLVLRTGAMLDSVETFLQTCATEGITVLDLPTAYWHVIAAELGANSLTFPPSLRLVIIGGEAALPERLETWQAHASAHIRLVNTYGPTETTIVATMCDLTGEDAPESAAKAPIGKPATNTQVYVLDPQLRPMPAGVPGELYIGSAGLARGYLNRPGLTAAAFVPDPFSGVAGARLYKTGDLVRYLPDGNLEFLGRVDHQVKIRGFRVELGEIESVLSQHPAVREAVVLAHDKKVPSDKRLVAYVVPGEAQTHDLRDFVRERLPDYMVPSIFVPLDVLPLTASGKIDRRALPAPDGAQLYRLEEFVPPETPLEEKLAKIWAKVLGVERVGIFDNFFDLGGDSLLGTQVISRINRALGVNVPMYNLLEEPTIANLALLIEEMLIEEIETAS